MIAGQMNFSCPLENLKTLQQAVQVVAISLTLSNSTITPATTLPGAGSLLVPMMLPDTFLI